ncbi:MAG: YDR341C-like protein [Piptocephalis tieghemiana]|nr:MAG: YDR341C-like protein [Piptocephalis tieghemiana]
MLDEFKAYIADQVSSATGADRDLVLTAIGSPKSPEHGDFAVAIPRLRLKGNPAAFAKETAEKFVPNELVTSAEPAGPFLNFRISKEYLRNALLPQIAKAGESYGKNEKGKGKRVVVEFSSPNIAKPFHAGHLRSTIIGSFVRNVHDVCGYETIAMNYLGDWGKQYGLLAVGFSKHGDAEKLAKDPIKHLYDVYVAINKDAEERPEIHDEARAYFKRMEDGDEEALGQWRRFRDLSIIKYQETYARLNIRFDTYSGESQVDDGMRRALKLLQETGLLIESEGAKIVDLKKEKMGTAVVEKKDGTTLYITRDIGAAMERYEKYKFDHMYYVVASQQELHLRQLFKILEKLGFEWASKCSHISFGMINGISTRKGTAVFLDNILEDTKETMHTKMRENEAKYAQIPEPERVADIVGRSALMIQDMAARRIKNYDFDWNRIFSFEGDTGPYLQYAHARLCSIERNASQKVRADADLTLLTEPSAYELIQLLAQYPDVVLGALSSLEPCSVVQYVLKVSHAVSVAFSELWVVGQEDKVAEARLLMYHCARVTLGNALRMLGLTPLERM